MAVTPTANRSYSKQAVGDTNWHTALNTTMDLIDADVNTLNVEVIAARTSSVYGAKGSVDLRIEAGEAEILAARGSKSSLDNRISVALNDDGTIIDSAYVYAQWSSAGLAGAAYASARTFTVTGDVTAILTPGMVIKIDYDSTGDRFCRVKDSTFGASTTVTIWDADPEIINETITAIYTSPVKINWRDDDGSIILPGANLGDWIAHMSAGEFITYYYAAFNSGTAATYSSPFAGNGLITGAGKVARIEYESGMVVGYTYRSTAPVGRIDKVEYKVSIGGTLTIIETHTATYDATTKKLTNMDRS